MAGNEPKKIGSEEGPPLVLGESQNHRFELFGYERHGEFPPEENPANKDCKNEYRHDFPPLGGRPLMIILGNRIRWIFHVV